MDCLKGLYFLQVDLKSHSLFHNYMLTSLHLEVTTGSNMFKNYEELEQLCIDVLEQCRKDVQLLNLAYTI